METNQVRYFLALCEEKNFTRAAKRCGVSQPSVSNAIKRLEEELGSDLFHRTKNGAKLSSLGVAIRPYLDQINECAEGARREAAYISTADMLSIPARAKRGRFLIRTSARALRPTSSNAFFPRHAFRRAHDEKLRNISRPRLLACMAIASGGRGRFAMRFEPDNLTNTPLAFSDVF